MMDKFRNAEATFDTEFTLVDRLLPIAVNTHHLPLANAQIDLTANATSDRKGCSN
jgi:hypothetical protein